MSIRGVKQHVENGKDKLAKAHESAEWNKTHLAEQMDLSDVRQALGEIMTRLAGMQDPLKGELMVAQMYATSIQHGGNGAQREFEDAFGFGKTDNDHATGMKREANKAGATGSGQLHVVRDMRQRVGAVLEALQFAGQQLDEYDFNRRYAAGVNDQAIAHTAAAIEHAEQYEA